MSSKATSKVTFSQTSQILLHQLSTLTHLSTTPRWPEPAAQSKGFMPSGPQRLASMFGFEVRATTASHLVVGRCDFRQLPKLLLYITMQCPPAHLCRPAESSVPLAVLLVQLDLGVVCQRLQERDVLLVRPGSCPGEGGVRVGVRHVDVNTRLRMKS